MTNPTPGQVAYESYANGMRSVRLLTGWSWLSQMERRAWEAAAQAAITAWWQAHEAVICGEEDTPC